MPQLSMQDRDALLAGLQLLKAALGTKSLEFNAADPESNYLADLYRNGGAHQGLDAAGISGLADLLVNEYPNPPIDTQAVQAADPARQDKLELSAIAATIAESLPAEKGYGKGFKDALESMSLALVSQVAEATLRDAVITALDAYANNADDQVAGKPRVLVVVNGGVAEPVSDNGVDVQVFDWDNYQSDPEGTGKAPQRFADLALSVGVPVDDVATPVGAAVSSPQGKPADAAVQHVQLTLLQEAVEAKIRYWDAATALEHALFAGPDEMSDRQSDIIVEGIENLAVGLDAADHAFLQVSTEHLTELQTRLGIQPTAELGNEADAMDVFKARLLALPRLQQQAGAVYTLGLVASKATQVAFGFGKGVDWSKVHQDVFDKAVGQDRQPVDQVLAAIKLHSPGAVTPQQIAAVDAMAESRGNVLFSKLRDVSSGLDVIEDALEDVTSGGDLSQAPFPLVGNEAGIYLTAQKGAYLHVLEMCSAQSLAKWMAQAQSATPDEGVLLAKLQEVVQGLEVIEAALKTSSNGDLSQAPFPLVGREAQIHLDAQKDAYLHALEMCGSESIQKFVQDYKGRAVSNSRDDGPSP